MPKIKFSQAQATVNDFVQKQRFGKFLRLINLQAITLPRGWRFPYELYIHNVRRRSTMLILYISKQQEDTQNITITVERNDLDTLNQQEQIKNLVDNEFQETIVSEIEVVNLIAKKLKGAEILKIEQVYDYAYYQEKENQSSPLYQRVNVLLGSKILTVLVGRDKNGQIFLSEPESKGISGVVAPIQLGWPNPKDRLLEYITITPKKQLTINYEHLPKNRVDIRGQWAALSCMSIFIEYMQQNKLMPKNQQNQLMKIDMYSIQLIQTDSIQHVPNYSHSTGTPTITFGYGSEEGSWAEDPSVGLHECGHAVLGLHFVQHPAQIESTNKDAIAEGFGDYFASILLHDDTTLVDNWTGVLIGGALSEKIPGIGSIGLPRQIDGTPLQAKPAFGIHNLGKMWANYLWDVRRHWCRGAQKPHTRQKRAKQFDKAVIDTHLTPTEFLIDDGATNLPLWATYVDILKLAAKLHKVNIKDEIWLQIVTAHHLLT